MNNLFRPLNINWKINLQLLYVASIKSFSGIFLRNWWVKHFSIRTKTVMNGKSGGTGNKGTEEPRRSIKIPQKVTEFSYSKFIATKCWSNRAQSIQRKYYYFKLINIHWIFWWWASKTVSPPHNCAQNKWYLINGIDINIIGNLC